MSTQRKKFITSIQVFRGVASLLIVIYHAQVLVTNYAARGVFSGSIIDFGSSLHSFGESGVDLLFTISGFVMAWTSEKLRGSFSGAWHFIARRLIRIVPIYWFYTTIMALALFFLPQLFATARFAVDDAIRSYLFIPYVSTVSPSAPILQVGWTLSYEMYFYALIAIGLIMSSRRFAVLLILFMGGSILLGNFMTDPGPITKLFIYSKLFDFAVGFACGTAYLAGLNPPKSLAPAVVATGVAGYLAWGIADFSMFPPGWYGVLIGMGCIFWERQSNLRFPLPLVVLGDSSYSLYLSHYLFIPFLGKVCTLVGFWRLLPPEAFIVFAAGACIVVGWISYRFVETPLMALCSVLFLPERPTSAIVPSTSSVQLSESAARAGEREQDAFSPVLEEVDASRS